jgi:hypothetical protein
MNARILFFLVCFASAKVLAQGTLNFANVGGGVNAPVTNLPIYFPNPGSPGWQVAGPFAPASGSAFLAQLYVGPFGTTDWSLLTTNGVSGAPAPFLTGNAAGYFTGNTRTISGYPGGSTITAQVRVWHAPGGASWEQAGVYNRGESVLIQVTLAAPPSVPSSLIGLQPVYLYNVVSVPEPSAIMLLGLALSSLFFWPKLRRRNDRSKKDPVSNLSCDAGKNDSADA